MNSADVRPWGVRINGRWYWNEALYGYRGRVFCKMNGEAVDIYSMNMERICTAEQI